MALPKSKFTGERRGGARIPPKMDLCRGCEQFVHQGSTTCHHCGCKVMEVNGEYYAKLRDARAAAFQVDLILRRMRRRKAKEAAKAESEE